MYLPGDFKPVHNHNKMHNKFKTKPQSIIFMLSMHRGQVGSHRETWQKYTHFQYLFKTVNYFGTSNFRENGIPHCRNDCPGLNDDRGQSYLGGNQARQVFLILSIFNKCDRAAKLRNVPSFFWTTTLRIPQLFQDNTKNMARKAVKN